MQSVKIVLFALILSAFSNVRPVSAQDQTLSNEDRTRLREAFSLAAELGDAMWADWSAVPFTFLLVTQENEFLFNHDNPTDDFTDLGFDALLNTHIFVRPNSGRFSTSFLATFPAINGKNTVVMGQPASTGKTSTEWVVTALHEHFHQYQFTHPGYWDKVAGLDLADGDETGMWMLNYPYPYESPAIQVSFEGYESALEAALLTPELPLFKQLSDARRALRSGLTDAQFRYQSFQLWQEGVARYTEIHVAKWASEHRSPSAAFLALSDNTTYESVHNSLVKDLHTSLNSHAIADLGRVAFYAAGAAEALLLDFQDSGWRERYFEDMPYLDVHTTKF